MALPWIIFKRDRARYDAEMPHLPVDRFQLHTYVLYLLSGGVSMRSFAPGAALHAAAGLEQLLAPAVAAPRQHDDDRAREAVRQPPMTTVGIRSQVAADNHDLNAAEIRQGRSHLSSTPLQINIDLTGICNIHPPCVFCSGKNVGYNYAPVNVAALDAYAPYLERCERVNDDSFGEPLSHPSLVDVARRFIARGQNFSFVSNGLLLTRDKARQLAELGPNLGMHVSFNAATAETFYRLTGKSFDLLVENVRTFVDVFREQNGASRI